MNIITSSKISLYIEILTLIVLLLIVCWSTWQAQLADRVAGLVEDAKVLMLVVVLSLPLVLSQAADIVGELSHIGPSFVSKVLLRAFSR